MSRGITHPKDVIAPQFGGLPVGRIVRPLVRACQAGRRRTGKRWLGRPHPDPGAVLDLALLKIGGHSVGHVPSRRSRLLSLGKRPQDQQHGRPDPYRRRRHCLPASVPCLLSIRLPSPVPIGGPCVETGRPLHRFHRDLFCMEHVDAHSFPQSIYVRFINHRPESWSKARGTGTWNGQEASCYMEPPTLHPLHCVAPQYPACLSRSAVN